MPDIIHVAVAVIVNDSGDVCISLRHENTHQGWLWEFPGGKIESGESAEVALAREIFEEINIQIEAAEEFQQVNFDYPEKSVSLIFYLVKEFSGTPCGNEGQEVEYELEDGDKGPKAARIRAAS